MPKYPVNVIKLAKAQTEAAIATLAEVMTNPKNPPGARVNAACALLDRGWGRPDVSVRVSASGSSESPLAEIGVELLARFLESLRAKEAAAIDVTPAQSQIGTGGLGHDERLESQIGTGESQNGTAQEVLQTGEKRDGSDVTAAVEP